MRQNNLFLSSVMACSLGWAPLTHWIVDSFNLVLLVQNGSNTDTESGLNYAVHNVSTLQFR